MEYMTQNDCKIKTNECSEYGFQESIWYCISKQEIENGKQREKCYNAKIKIKC